MQRWDRNGTGDCPPSQGSPSGTGLPHAPEIPPYKKAAPLDCSNGAALPSSNARLTKRREREGDAPRGFAI